MRKMARICWIATLVGVFSLIVVASIMNGFNRSIRTKLLSLEPHLTLSGSKAEALKAQQLIFDDIQSLPTGSAGRGVKTNLYARQDVILRTLEGRFSGAVAKGLDAESLQNFMRRVHHLRFKTPENSLAVFEEARLEPNEIMLGADLARDLNLFDGDELILIQPESLLGPQSETPRFERMKVRSQFTTDSPDADGKLILFRLSDSQLRFQSEVSGEYGVEFRFPHPDQHTQWAKRWAGLIGLGNKSAGGDEASSLKFESWADRNQALFLALRLEKTAMMTFLGLSVLITCFSLITVLIMLISQKRKEIGLLMALGLSRRRTQRLFLSVGVMLSGLGLFGGLVLGILVSILIDKYPLDILPDIYYDSSLPSEISYPFVGAVAIFCVLVAFSAAYWPVRNSMKRTPSQNLRPFVVE